MKTKIAIAILILILAGVSLGARYEYKGIDSIYTIDGWKNTGDTLRTDFYFDDTTLWSPLSDTLGASWVTFADTFLIAAGATDSFVVPFGYYDSVSSIVIVTTGRIECYNNDLSAQPDIFPTDIVATLKNIDRRTRKLILIGVSTSSSVTITAYNGKYDD